MELINFLIEHFYFSAPLVIVLILFFISNSKSYFSRSENDAVFGVEASNGAPKL